MDDYTKNIFFDTNLTIKEEPLSTDNSIMSSTSASVPIPTRRSQDITCYRSLSTDIENSQSPLQQENIMNFMTNTTSMWSNRLIGSEDSFKSEALIHMDDDDIFQVDKADLIQGPTLAELNANDDTLLGDLNFDDLLLPEEGPYLSLSQKIAVPFLNINNSNYLNNNSPNNTSVSSSCPQSGMLFYKDLDIPGLLPSSHLFNTTPKTPVSAFSPESQTSSNSSLFQSSPLHTNSTPQHKHSTLHELLVKRENFVSPDRSHLGQSVPGQNTPSTSPNVRSHRMHTSRLSSSAPTHLGLEQIWQRREPRKHYFSTSSQIEAGSTSSLSTAGILSPDPGDISNDDFESDDDSDHHYEDMSSENDSDDEDNSTRGVSSSKKERYFWQYNVQAKGPKGQRLVMKCKMEDPHVLNEVTDPVFSPDCSVRGIKHSGKARKGDGNDLTPNARKLYNIGKELDKLGRIINEMTPVSELPFNVRPKSRKEKNKLASRACRLKKKAQHEANKIKLSGLEVEHKNILNGILQCKEIILARIRDQPNVSQEALSPKIESICKLSTRIKVAGYTADYVNTVLDALKKDVPTNIIEAK